MKVLVNLASLVVLVGSSFDVAEGRLRLVRYNNEPAARLRKLQVRHSALRQDMPIGVDAPLTYSQRSLLNFAVYYKPDEPGTVRPVLLCATGSSLVSS